MMQYQETTKDIRSIGEELGAAAILEGSVLTVGDQVSVNAQLIDAVTDEHLWAENYQRAYTVQNLFDLQREIAEQITGALSATLLPEERSELAAVPTEDLDAYNFFLRGNTYFNNGPRSEDFEVAFQMYERSVEIDPDFAEAWAKLSLAHSQRCQNYNSCSRPATIRRFIICSVPSCAAWMTSPALSTVGRRPWSSILSPVTFSRTSGQRRPTLGDSTRQRAPWSGRSSSRPPNPRRIRG
jgi:tetratricopeptide (TPR) repeat protein